MNALNAYMDSLVSSYGSIVQTYVTAQADNQTLAFIKEQEGQRARVSAYLDAYNAAQVDTFTQQNDRLRSELRMYYDQWLRTNSLLTAARTLQDQVARQRPAATPLPAAPLPSRCSTCRWSTAPLPPRRRQAPTISRLASQPRRDSSDDSSAALAQPLRSPRCRSNSMAVPRHLPMPPTCASRWMPPSPASRAS